MTICDEVGCERRATSRGYCGKHYAQRKRLGQFATKYKAPWGAHKQFLERYRHYTGDDCVFWTFGHNGNGYGRVTFEGRKDYAHRVMCRWTHGQPPTDKPEAAHTCGKGHLGCVNPRHLQWASPLENQRHKRQHGTLSFGERRYNHKLSDEVVANILKDDRPQKVIAAQLGVNPSVISRIRSGLIWKHVTGGGHVYHLE